MTRLTAEQHAAALVERLGAALCAHPPRRAASTYRLQLTPAFGFRDAAGVVDYLHELGVTDVYLSPPFAAATGSTHGYDVTDHNRLRPELGGEAGYAALCAALAARGMGQVVDFVPNHMGIGADNPWWIDLLENGPSSLYAPFFDVDWRPLKDELENKVLVPVLGDQFGRVLERGELQLVRDEGRFLLVYFGQRFPVAPRQVPRLLSHRLEELVAALGEGNVHVHELLSVITSLEKLAPRHEVDGQKVAERAREKEVAKRRLAALFRHSPAIAAFVDENLRIFNGVPGDPRSFDRLEALLEDQAYRLAHWRVAGEEINYRRFFDINSLAAIRMEDPNVFEETHRLLLQLVRTGQVGTLRIDHPDGLYAPTAYFARLQETYLVDRALALAGDQAASDQPAPAPEELAALRAALFPAVRQAMGRGALPSRPLPVVVEKILEGRERMPASWAVDGTTGYEFLNAVNGLYVQPASVRAFDRLYAEFTGEAADFAELVYTRKRFVMTSSMASEIAVLGHRLNRISETDRLTRDFTLSSLTRALVEYVANLPIYRTYIEGTTAADVTARDRHYVEATIARARRRTPELDPSIHDFLRDVLLLRHPEHLPAAQQTERLELVRKVQQITGPVTAKAIEDTAFYIHHRLVSLNEVGGNPEQFGVDPLAFHAWNAERLLRWPGSLNATTTHDTKRSEDARLRIDALSEIPEEWRGRLRRWRRRNRRYKTAMGAELLPARNDELLLYQTLVAVWPTEPGAGADPLAELVPRVQTYLQKALREAKVRTSWTNPDPIYEQAMRDFVAQVIASEPFRGDFTPFAARLAHAARLSSLSQTALKVVCPGAADVYQGTELWDTSLVDPDNRRPVDFERRRELLARIAARLAEGPAARRALVREVTTPAALPTGAAKLLLLREVLRDRRADPELYLEGDYVPLGAEGVHAAHAVALARRARGRRLVCVAPRLLLTLLDGARAKEQEQDKGPQTRPAQDAPVIAWDGAVELPPDLRGRYVDLVTGIEVDARGALSLAACFAEFPVAVLRSAG